MAVVNKPRRNPNRSWVYPDLVDVFTEVGVHALRHSIQVQRNTIVQFFMDWMIHALVMDGRRRRGDQSRHYWWEKLMSLDEEEAEPHTKYGP